MAERIASRIVVDMLDGLSLSLALTDADLPLDLLEREIMLLAGHLNAPNYRLLVLLAEFERRGGHAGFGIQSCAHWLSWKCGIGLIAAREKMRVARALTRLPKISEAMRTGTLSYCMARAITRVATPENEDYLLYIAWSGTVSHVEKLVRLYRKTERAKELAEHNERSASRSVTSYFDHDGCLVLQARLDPEQGVLVMKALQAATDALREAEGDSRESCEAPDAARNAYPARRADALVLLAETFLAGGAAPLAAGERHMVIVHVDDELLRNDDGEGRCHVEDGPSLPPATVRRLCCDGSLVGLVDGAGGTAVDVGRKTRAIPSGMRRALHARDEGCRFPGCTNTRFVDAHHVEHWTDGGETRLSNLVELCRRHHRFVHEHGFRVEQEGGQIRFLRPDGRVVANAPALGPMDASRGWVALAGRHAQLGLAIGHRTASSRWKGERMDYSWAVGALQRRAVARAPVRTAQG